MISALSYYGLGRLMQEFLPHILVNQALALRTWRPGQVEIEHLRGSLEIVPTELREVSKSGFERLRDECIKLKLKASYASVHRILETLDDPSGVWRAMADDATDLESRIIDELKYTTCFALEGKAEEFYRADQLFGSKVADRFPEAGEDIAEAGKCLALDRGTACVMHLQRVLECGLDALGKAVGVVKPMRDWGKYVEEIAKELERSFKASGARTPDEQFYAESYVTFDAIRRAWRNPSMHVEKTHTPDQAEAIFVSSKSFMQHLATRL